MGQNIRIKDTEAITGENKLKVETREQRSGTAKGPGPSVFSGLEKRLKLEAYFEDGFPVKHLPKVLFCMFLSLVYISNTHYAEKTTRAIVRANSDVADLRADFITLKSDVMFASKQSEVARRVKTLGLKESSKPPFKIVVEEGEY